MSKLTRRAFLQRAAALAALPWLDPNWPPLADPFVIVDAHEDLAWNILNFGRDYTRSAHETREHERAAGEGVPWLAGEATVGLPDWLRGRVAVVGATVFVMPQAHAQPADTVIYADADQAHTWAMAQMDAYDAFAAANSAVQLIGTAADLDAVVESWAGGADPAARRVGLLRYMEGADPIRAPDECGVWFERGLRAVGISWKRTRYAGGTDEPGPVTDLGRALLDEMAALGMMLDLSHSSDEAFYYAIEHFDGVMFASHSNPRDFCPWQRCPTDEMIALLAERGGVIGVVLYNGYLKPGWRPRENTKSEVSVEDAADVIDHICQLLGDCAHVGIGSDFDGGLGLAHVPREMDTIADLNLIGEALRMRGYTEENVKAIMGGNWLRLYREGLPA